MVHDLSGNSLLLGIVIGLALFIVLDLLVAGGGMMSGMAGMMGTPWGGLLLLLLLALVLLVALA